ncbi:hypothetical protein Tco_0711040, partial [Tanacetum coccineum]
ATTTTGGSSNDRRQQQRPAAAATKVNPSQPQSTTEPPPPPAAAATTGGSSKDRRQQQLKSTPVNHRRQKTFVNSSKELDCLMGLIQLQAKRVQQYLPQSIAAPIIEFAISLISLKSPDKWETNFSRGNAKDDDFAHVLDDDDDVVVSDDDEVNPSTNVEEMACVHPRSHGGDAGGSPPGRPNRHVPAQCESSNLRIETGNASLRRAFRQNDQRL